MSLKAASSLRSVKPQIARWGLPPAMYFRYEYSRPTSMPGNCWESTNLLVLDLFSEKPENAVHRHAGLHVLLARRLVHVAGQNGKQAYRRHDDQSERHQGDVPKNAAQKISNRSTGLVTIVWIVWFLMSVGMLKPDRRTLTKITKIVIAIDTTKIVFLSMSSRLHAFAGKPTCGEEEDQQENEENPEGAPADRFLETKLGQSVNAAATQIE